MLGSSPLNQLEKTPEICLFFFCFFCWVTGKLSTFRQMMKVSEICLMLSLHLVQSLRIMALTVFKASCLAKWPWCEVDDDESEACCDEGDDAMIASGSEASEGCVDRLAWAI